MTEPQQGSPQGSDRRVLEDLTIVMAAYNASATIESSLRSVALFTGARAIVVDDGSTDDTAELARALGATVIEQANSGAAAARARGLREVRSPFVTFLDSDDQLEAGVQALVELLRQDPGIAVAGGRIMRITSAGIDRGAGPAPEESYSTQELLAFAASPWPPAAAVWRLSSLRDAQQLPEAPLDPRYAEDYEQLVRGSRVGRVVGIPSITARYRAAGGKSTSAGTRAIESAERIRSYYAGAFHLVAPAPLTPRGMRRVAAWRRFRSLQVENGVPSSLITLVREPRLGIAVLGAAGQRVVGRLRRSSPRRIAP